MFVIEEAKLPPPTPVSAATTISVAYETPGFDHEGRGTVGTSSSSALTTVQLRPPNTATAKVYGTRSMPPTSVGIATRKNLPPGRPRRPGP